ncbi:MAG TPA: flagellar biosynthesis protein FlgE [Sulfurospirillum sp. UBA11407]|nr:MAG TPA: flagellar biosynthesis protein FlgE [Sulfurospirillum sp. UBA11407]
MQVNVNSMIAHNNWMSSNSHNVANVNTKDFQSTSTTIQGTPNGGIEARFSQNETNTDLSKELSEQIPIEKSFQANASAIKTKDEMIGSLLDLSI